MVKHNQLDVKGAPWPIQKEGRGGACIPGRQRFPSRVFLAPVHDCLCSHRAGCVMSFLYLPRLQDLVSHRSLFLMF